MGRQNERRGSKGWGNSYSLFVRGCRKPLRVFCIVFVMGFHGEGVVVLWRRHCFVVVWLTSRVTKITVLLSKLLLVKTWVITFVVDLERELELHFFLSEQSLIFSPLTVYDPLSSTYWRKGLVAFAPERFVFYFWLFWSLVQVSWKFVIISAAYRQNRGLSSTACVAFSLQMWTDNI